MAINVDFKNAVDAQKVRLVRIMLKDSLVIDPTFAEFNDLLRYAEANLEGLYDNHDDEEFSLDISKWNKDMLNEQMVNVVYNFSRDRIELLKQMCTHIYADRIEAKMSEKNNSNIQPIDKKQVGTGMIIGGGVAVVVGWAVSQTVVTVAGVAVAIAGGIIYSQEK